MEESLDRWEKLLPELNQLRRDGLYARKIAEHFGISLTALYRGMRWLNEHGFRIAVVSSRKKETTQDRIKLIEPLLGLGLSAEAMGKKVGLSKGIISAICTHSLSPEQRAIWENSRRRPIAGQGKSRNALSNRRKAEKHRRGIIAGQELAATFREGKRPINATRGAMEPGGVSWSVLWGGNPPPYPYEMLKGRFS